MAGCSSLGGVHSQVLHFYVLVFPINIQKCLVITRSGFIYMQSASVVRNCSGKVFFFFFSLFFLLFAVLLLSPGNANLLQFNSNNKHKNIIQKIYSKIRKDLSTFAWAPGPSLLCKCNPTLRGWGKIWDGSFTLSNDTTLRLSMYYQTVFAEALTWKRSARAGPCNNTKTNWNRGEWRTTWANTVTAILTSPVRPRDNT